MPARRTLGANLGKGGGMLSAMGLAPAPKAPEVEAAPPARPSGRPAEARNEPQPVPPSPAKAPRAPVAPARPAPAFVEPQAAAAGPHARVATDISASALQLAKRAAYWNRETLRNFLERAIEAEARRIANELGLDTLPAAPPLRRGRPFQP